MFFNRFKELSHLEKIFKSDGAHFIIVYGRRRIGKTELLRQFSNNKPHLFFASDLSSEKEQLRQFTEKIYAVSGESFLADQQFGSWDALFRYMFDHLAKKIPLIIIDEFPYLCAENPALPSILQKIWDEKGKDSNVFLILCGSYMSFMEKEILGSKSPLFGRRTGQMLMDPIRFQDLKLFFPNYSEINRVYVYAILGGAPAYLQRFNDRQSIEENVMEEILNKNAMLYSEPRFLLMEELRDPSFYFLILKAISFGRNHLNEIVQETGGADRQKVAKYLSVLQELRLVEREVPVTENKPHKSRKGIYRIKDPFFRFWFRYVYPNFSFLEENDAQYVWEEKIKPSIDSFAGPVFESICLEALKNLNRENQLPFKAARMGRWWEGAEEIDIVALDDQGTFLFCECKWSRKMMTTRVLNDLIRKTEGFQGADKKYYGLFSRAGFRKELKERALDRGDVLLLDFSSF